MYADINTLIFLLIICLGLVVLGSQLVAVKKIRLLRFSGWLIILFGSYMGLGILFWLVNGLFDLGF